VLRQFFFGTQESGQKGTHQSKQRRNPPHQVRILLKMPSLTYASRESISTAEDDSRGKEAHRGAYLLMVIASNFIGGVSIK